MLFRSTDINAKHCLAYLIRFFSLLLSDASLALSSFTSLALFVWHSCHALSLVRSRHADLAIADLVTLRDRDHPGSPLIIDPLCDEEELQCEGTVAGSENFH